MTTSYYIVHVRECVLGLESLKRHWFNLKGRS